MESKTANKKDKESKDKSRSGFVALVGRPNVGKSSFLNELIGQKIAIVSPKVQTTRTKILGVYTFEPEVANAQVVFLDLPGMHKPVDKLGETCLQISLDGAKEADLVIFMSEAGFAPGKGDQWIANWLKENCPDKPIVVALNKKDLLKTNEKNVNKTLNNSQKYLDLFAGNQSSPKLVFTSAKQKESFEDLMKIVLEHLLEGPFYFPEDIPTNRSLRFLTSELIREQVLLHTSEEVPHSCAIEIVEFKEPNPEVETKVETETTKPKNLTSIRANILVETESQKGIIVGKKGSKIKEIGTKARKEIEKLLEGKVFLELKVKKNRNWRNSQQRLKEMSLDEET